MPELDFQIVGAETAASGLVPLIQFQLAITNRAENVNINAVLLHAQIQIQAPQRGYNASEKAKLLELFGTPDRWGQTLRNRLWTATDTNIGGFSKSATAQFSVPCTYDLTFAATKYFYALEEGNIPLLFLFSGTVFYQAEDGRLQAQPISWDKESVFRLPLELWQGMMDGHFPNSAWIYLQRDVFDRLYAYKRSQGNATWEETIEHLLLESKPQKSEVLA